MWLQAVRMRGASVGALIRDWWVAYMRQGRAGWGGAGMGVLWGWKLPIVCAWALRLLTAALLAVLWIAEAWCSSAVSPAENLDGGGKHCGCLGIRRDEQCVITT